MDERSHHRSAKAVSPPMCLAFVVEFRGTSDQYQDDAETDVPRPPRTPPGHGLNPDTDVLLSDQGRFSTRRRSPIEAVDAARSRTEIQAGASMGGAALTVQRGRTTA